MRLIEFRSGISPYDKFSINSDYIVCVYTQKGATKISLQDGSIDEILGSYEDLRYAIINKDDFTPEPPKE